MVSHRCSSKQIIKIGGEMKKSLRTPKSQIRSALRRLFLRSRERATAIKRDKYTFYVEVHHRKGIMNWEILFEIVYLYLLCHPDDMETLCKKCHKEAL
jgi:hypothetical protein